MVVSTSAKTICLICTIFAACVFGWHSVARAEVPLKSLSQLKKQANCIVVGQIEDIATVEKRTAEPGVINLELRYAVKVSAVEKGEAQSGESLVAVAWIRKQVPEGYVGSAGHCYLPAVGEQVRVFLNFDQVMLPNGFAVAEDLNGITEKRFSSIQGGFELVSRTELMKRHDEAGTSEEDGPGYGSKKDRPKQEVQKGRKRSSQGSGRQWTLGAGLILSTALLVFMLMPSLRKDILDR